MKAGYIEGVLGSVSIYSLQERFWSKVDMSGGLLACWPWLGAKSKKRAGTVRGHLIDRATRRHYLAHRLALCFAGEGLEEYSRPQHAAHRCHNRLCCNTYSHLYWASDQENREDRQELERRLSLGLTTWEPIAWYHCDTCGNRELKRWQPKALYFCTNCLDFRQFMWTLVDLERVA